MRAVPRRGAGLAGQISLVVALTTSTTSCAAGHAEEATTDGTRFTTSALRACLDKHPGQYDGLLFRTTARASDSFVGVIMMDLTTTPARTATVGIAVYDDAELLEAYEERARRDPTDEVVRVRNAVVSSHTPGSPRLAMGERWVANCLR
jgi:hypothetical protein